MRRPVAFLVSLPLTDELALLSAPKIMLTLEMVDMQSGVDPNELVAGACHANQWRIIWGLRLGDTWDQHKADDR